MLNIFEYSFNNENGYNKAIPILTNNFEYK